MSIQYHCSYVDNPDNTWREIQFMQFLCGIFFMVLLFSLFYVQNIPHSTLFSKPLIMFLPAVWEIKIHDIKKLSRSIFCLL